jgi:hypothetical protein
LGVLPTKVGVPEGSNAHVFKKPGLRMPRHTVTAGVLDALIKARLSALSGCEEVKALGVTHSPAGPGGANWTVPGWVGGSDAVSRCRDHMLHYLDYLGSQYDIPRGEASGRTGTP